VEDECVYRSDSVNECNDRSGRRRGRTTQSVETVLLETFFLCNGWVNWVGGDVGWYGAMEGGVEEGD
jgi:hypothetical protein